VLAWRQKLGTAMVAGCLGLSSCSEVSVGRACGVQFQVNFGKIDVAGAYEFRAAVPGRSTLICQMSLRPNGLLPTCPGFYRFEGDLDWRMPDADQFITIGMFRDGVLIGERTFLPRYARGVAEESGCPPVSFSFTAGEIEPW